MSKLLPLVIVCASAPAMAGTPVARLGATAGFQRTDRSAWVIGPALEVKILDELAIRAEAQLELGDFDDPFGDTNIRDGHGPHVNHVLLGPSWRPRRYADYAVAAGAEAGIMVMHSTFAHDHFNIKPAAGLFVQAGRMLGPVTVALQLRFDVSGSVGAASPTGGDVPTTTGRINLAFEVPITL
jgi:hypothetical protein